MTSNQTLDSGRTVRLQDGPQRAFGQSPADIVIFGGAAGGGKSFALVFEAARNSHVPGYAAVIFRRTQPELRGGGGIWNESQKLYPLRGGVPREHTLEWRFPSGATVEFRHLQHEKDVLSHQSKQYAFVGFDELTHFTEQQFRYMVSRLRSTCGVRPYMRCSTNPHPDSFVRKLIDWWIGEDGYAIPERSGVLRWFVIDGEEYRWASNPDELTAIYPRLKPQSLTFIPSMLEDNPALMRSDPEYEGRLMTLPKVQREQLRWANWNIRPKRGDFFGRDMFVVVDVCPSDVVSRVRAWDRAATKPTKENPDPDWTVGTRYSRLKAGPFCVEHVNMLRDAPFGVESAVVNTADADKEFDKRCAVGLWQDPGAAGKSDAAHYARLLARHTVRTVVAAKNKQAYAAPVSSQAAAGNILVVRGPWNDAFFRGIEPFPEGHDDIVDSMSLGHLLTADSHLARLRSLASYV